LTRLLERGRPELLGQFAQLDPLGAVNKLAASLAGRIYSRLGA
jgi:hypothetical protein